MRFGDGAKANIAQIEYHEKLLAKTSPPFGGLECVKVLREPRSTSSTRIVFPSWNWRRSKKQKHFQQE